MHDATIEAIEAALPRMRQATARIHHILAGLQTEEQGAVLADLLACHIAGHFVTDELHSTSRPLTKEIRDLVLTTFINTVRELIPVSEKQLLDALSEQAVPTSPTH
jgi:hypothetical protein